MGDYCDRCGAIGRSRFLFSNGFDLVFCGHHAREYKDKLNDVSDEDYQFMSEDAFALTTV